jgi:HSP20 family protein
MTLIKFNQPSPKFATGWVENVLNDLALPLEKTFNSSRPSVNIKETPDTYHLELMAPGRTKEDFKINLDKNLLTISYENKNGQKDEKYIMKEFALQSFERSFVLDEKINADDIKAKYENGVLSLELPKKAETKVIAKEITVQ